MQALTFPTRARIRRSELSTQKRYDAKGAPWSIIEVRGVFGHYWLVVRRCHGGEYVVSRHRKRRPAEMACRSKL